MTTKLISLHEFRKNLSSIWKTAKKKNEVYIVMVHSKPVLEVRPVKKGDFPADILRAIEAVWKSEEVQKTTKTLLGYGEKGKKYLTHYSQQGIKTIQKYTDKIL